MIILSVAWIAGDIEKNKLRNEVDCELKYKQLHVIYVLHGGVHVGRIAQPTTWSSWMTDDNVRTGDFFCLHCGARLKM